MSAIVASQLRQEATPRTIHTYPLRLPSVAISEHVGRIGIGFCPECCHPMQALVTIALRFDNVIMLWISEGDMVAASIA